MDRRPRHAFCRREFALRGTPARATLRVLADPHSYAIKHWQILPSKHPYDNWLVGGSFLKFRVFLNGTQVAVGPFRPLQDGVPVLHEFDVTEHLGDGANALAVLFPAPGGIRGFALSLEIIHHDGTAEVICTDNQWQLVGW